MEIKILDWTKYIKIDFKIEINGFLQPFDGFNINLHSKFTYERIAKLLCKVIMNLLSQKFPSYRGGHSQVATPFISLHKPPFLQGLGEHTLASIRNENKP